MKKISILFSLVLLASSCVKQMEEPESAKIAGMWAVVDDNDFTTKYIEFEHGNIKEYVSGSEKHYVADKSVWNCQEGEFKQSSTVRYSLIDGTLNYDNNHLKMHVDGESMTLGDMKCRLVDNFCPEYYSTINVSNSQSLFSFNGGGVEWSYKITNPVEGFTLKVKAPDWVSGLKVTADKISFTVAETTTTRTDLITLSYPSAEDLKISITQRAAEINLDKASVTLGYAASSSSFTYSIPDQQDGYTLKVEASHVWITNVRDNGRSISFSVKENNSGSTRTGKITVTYAGVSKVFTVTQSYTASSISFTPTSGSHDYTSGTYTFKYTVSNPREGQKATVSTSDSWITGVTDNNGTVSYTVSRNTTGSSRSGKITVKYGDSSKTFTITQSAASLTLSSSSTTCTYPSASKSFSITISNRQSDLAVSVKSDVSWITNLSESNGTVSYKVAENNSGSSRTGKITVTYAGVSKNFTLTQSYDASSISFTPTSGSHDYTSGTYTFKYTVSNPRENQKATVSTSDSWITGVSDSNGTVSYKVAENNSGSSRTGRITVTYAGVSKEFSVTQSYTAPSISLSPTSGSHDYTSGTYTFKYTVSNPREGQKVTVSTSDSWITGVTDNNGTVSYTVSGNTTGSSRSSKITVKYGDSSKTFTITQSAASLTLSSSSTTCTYASATKSFDITIPNRQSDLAVSIQSDASWITGVSESNGTVTYTIAENNSGASRTGKIIVTYAGVSKEFTVAQHKSPVDLSASATANCYIVTSAGEYRFRTVKGNSSTSVGTVSTAEVLWESLGNSSPISKGKLLTSAYYKDDYVIFETNSSYAEGNAVIAAKDAGGNILWSWHIWLTDYPQGQVYYNDAGTMMDRNLGAKNTSASSFASRGLLYQWGRKDPFLGPSSISSAVEATSTITWPSPVASTSSTGTVDYVTSHPTTFVTAGSSSDYDWHYSSRDNTLWTTSDKTKSIYDPCPAGWRVPDGGSSGVWSTAGFDDTTYDKTNKGISFSISSPSTTWYPASGYRGYGGDSFYDVGYGGHYWSASPYGNSAYSLLFKYSGGVFPSYYNYRASGQSVRCIKE